ncbi:MAG: NAD(P)/FAD-dependent oxidoreductase [Prevotellaceae bacterium]|nr:NAD(P)/FAD-dependent oxidoreductase [Prevotellaceae bacterium]
MRDGSIVIIGGGLGGLFTGAILAKEGFKVTIVEKNATLGGGLQNFSRFGTSFDTGMHVIGGMQPGGNIRRICEYLGIADKASVMDVDKECSDSLYFREDRRWYNIAKGKEGFVESLAAYFPQERNALRNYVRDLYAIVNEVDLFQLKPSFDSLTVHSDAFTQYADEFISSYFEDRRLRAVVAYMNPLYGGRGHQTPAYVHAIISVLYIEGTCRFVGGSSRFADLLADKIVQNGGRLVKGDAVSHVKVENRHITDVETSKGLSFKADTYISDIHPCALLRILSPGALPKAYCGRLDSIPNSYSAFSLYIKMKKGAFPYINHSEYCMGKYEDIWKFGRTDKPWPMGFLFMTPPEDNQAVSAQKVLVTSPMSFEQVRQWEHTTVGRRGDDYERWKEQRTQELLSQIDEMHPDFSYCIEAINASSPLTIRDFYGSKEGGISGFSKDARNLALSQIPVFTKIDNLFLTGQNVNLHGFCGVALTAITTCEAILGRNYVLNKLKG